MGNLRPTEQAYGELQQAYDHFNRALFDGRLPACLITFQRKNRTYGYFSGDRWADAEGGHCDEIAMNPAHFDERPLTDILSTLVHEMVHLEQHHFGKTSRNGYHNRQWADWMERVGLVPSNTGSPGGQRTGQQMTHYTATGGAFEEACKALLAGDFRLSYMDVINEGSQATGSKSGSRVKYTCPDCSAAVWGKALLRVACIECEKEMEAAE